MGNVPSILRSTMDHASPNIPNNPMGRTICPSSLRNTKGRSSPRTTGRSCISTNPSMAPSACPSTMSCLRCTDYTMTMDSDCYASRKDSLRRSLPYFRVPCRTLLSQNSCLESLLCPSCLQEDISETPLSGLSARRSQPCPPSSLLLS